MSRKKQSKEYKAAWERTARKKDPEKIRARDRANRARIRAAVIAGYGGKCTCCGESTHEFLTIEHVNGDGDAHRKKVGNFGVYRELLRLEFPTDGYTLLCMNCNFARRFGRTCPHQK
jgi:hypothetical protein